LSVWGAAWTRFFYQRGYLAYYGDAEAHLNIARRILDSRTPGYDQSALSGYRCRICC